MGDLNFRVVALGFASVGSIQRFPRVVDSVYNSKGRPLIVTML